MNKFGLQVQDLTKEMATRLKLNVQQGVIVTDVADNSIAAAQDIQREDVITEVDGKPITNVAAFREALKQSRSATRHSALSRSEGQQDFRGPEGERLTGDEIRRGSLPCFSRVNCSARGTSHATRRRFA